MPNTDDKIPKVGSVFASTLSRGILCLQIRLAMRKLTLKIT